MDKQKALRLILKFFVFTLALSSGVTVFAVISYANYALFNDWLPTKIFTYIGSIGIAMVTFYLVSTYLSKLVNFYRQPQARFIQFSTPRTRRIFTNEDVFVDYGGNKCGMQTETEETPTFLKPYRRK